MGQSKLELAVGTGKWDAGLKKAQQSLNNFTQAQGGLQQALDKESQKMQKFVQMMGGMESTAKTAKGQMNDYKSTIEQLTMQYNRMTEAQKKVIGQDYLQAIDQMKSKYQAVSKEIQEMNRSLNNVHLPDMKAGGGGLFAGLGDKMSGALQVFGGNMLTKAAGAVAGFGTEIAGMVQQGVALAQQGEGIRIAFERLGRGDILQGLREATHGTVTDLELMKAAVKFNDFKLPLDELGTMLAFAQQKAKDTGQSVDYMVDSIVTGLGRKSLMILDNLGLSANEVKEKMKETGDMTKAVGEIIREQMSKAGDYVETAADRAAQANVSLQNKMEELGRKFAPVEEASSQLWTSMKIGILDIIGGPLATLLNQLTEAGRLKNMLNNMNGAPGSGNTKVDQQLKKLNVIKKGGGSDYIFNSTLNGMMEDYNRQIMTLDAQIKNGGKRPGADSGESQDVRYLQQKMDALKIMRDQLAAGAKEINKPIKIESNIPNVTGGGKGGNKKTGKTTPTYAADSIAAQQALVSDLTKQWNEAGADVRDQYLQPLVEAEAKLKEMQNTMTLQKAQAEGKLNGVNLWQGDIDDITGGKRAQFAGTLPDLSKSLQLDNLPQFLSPLQQLNAELEQLRKNLEYAPTTEAYQEGLQAIADKQKEIANFKGIDLSKDADKSAKSFQAAAGAISQVGSALNGIEDPTAKILGIIAQAIASVAAGAGQAVSAKDTTSSGWAWIGAAAAITASMVAMISQIHSATGYAQGGIVDGRGGGFVGGTAYSGDNIGNVRLDSGELVLNRAQQSNLANALQSNPMGRMQLSAVVTGEQIRLVLNNNGRRTGRGEYVTTNFT